MKTLSYLSLMGVALLGLSACIEETFPEDSFATTEQVASSPSAIKASALGMPSAMAQGYFVYEEQVHETDMSYPQFMIAQTELLGDMYPEGSNSGYDWYRNYNTFDRTFGADSYFAYLPWFTCYKLIKTNNDILAAVDVTNPDLTDEAKFYGALAHTCRAFNYYMLTVFYQPVDNIYTDCSKLLDLTVPKVTESTTREEAKQNPRMTRDEMKGFLLSDLNKADSVFNAIGADGIKELSLGKTLPSLAVIYGLKAKVYMWFEDYSNAAEWAKKAVKEAMDNGASPVTASQWEDPNTGFAQANQAWLWYIHYDAENMGNLCNFTGWMSGEADWGYSSLTFPSIDKSLYDKIGANDFRHTTFLNPAKFDYYDYKTCRDEKFIKDAPAYLSLKFRCLSGDWQNYTVGGVVDVPVMRIEEMMLLAIEAETMASKDYASGAAQLQAWVNTWRDPDYVTRANDERSFELAMLDQLRIEFWGEGNAFPSAKRIKPDVIQNYEGTNAPADIFKINCKGIKPNWNFVIPVKETQSNQILEMTNNPDPSPCVPVSSRPTPIGEFAAN